MQYRISASFLLCYCIFCTLHVRFSCVCVSLHLHVCASMYVFFNVFLSTYHKAPYVWAGSHISNKHWIGSTHTSPSSSQTISHILDKNIMCWGSEIQQSSIEMLLKVIFAIKLHFNFCTNSAVIWLLDVYALYQNNCKVFYAPQDYFPAGIDFILSARFEVLLCSAYSPMLN